jgi:ABC-2 type transport system ATP-binding protein
MSGQGPGPRRSLSGGISVEGATRWYGSTLAVDNVSFQVRPGEVVGFLGPNGAGKSTLLKMISTWLPPSGGRIVVGGYDVVREPLAVRRALGYLPEHNSLYEIMRVDRFLDFVARIRGLRGRLLKERFDWAVEHCALQEVVAKRIHECSKGYRQRIGVAAALIHDPAVIVLDEPTHGLDPVQVVAFRRFLQGLREGKAILFSSHILSEVAAVSERVLVINRGRLLADARVDELKRLAHEASRDMEALVLDMVTAAPNP